MVISEDMHNVMRDEKKLQLQCQNGLTAQIHVTH